MPETKSEPAQTLTTVRYVQWLFEPSDKVAILVRNREYGETTQRITTAAKVIGAPVMAHRPGRWPRGCCRGGRCGCR